MLFSFLVVVVVVFVATVSGEYVNTTNSTMAATTCVCTTVPCPVAGANKLTEGKGKIHFERKNIKNQKE
jgi:hypothetical protein